MTYTLHTTSLEAHMLAAFRAKLVRFGICLLVGLAVLYALAPRLAGMYFIQRGANLLGTDLAGQDPAILTESLGDFQRAAELLPYDPLPLRYMAHVYQLSGHTDEALAILERALNLRPDSVLIRADMLQAHVLNADLAHAFELGIELGYTPYHFAVIGDRYRRSGDHAQALRWYEIAVLADADLAPRVAFNRLVSAALANDPSMGDLLHEAKTALPDLQVPQIGIAPVSVPGASLRWIEEGWIGSLSQLPSLSGLPLNHPYGGSRGVFWWNGHATLLVEVTEPGAYVVRVIAVNTAPPPVELAVGANGIPLRQVSLAAGDNTLSVIEVPVMLSTPMATVDLWFLNDAEIGGLNRDAYIEQVEILSAYQ